MADEIEASNQQVDDVSAFTEKAKDGAGEYDRWMAEIKSAEAFAKNKKWLKECRQIEKAYIDERQVYNDTFQKDYYEIGQGKYNIFWANEQILGPACYARTPKVEITRKHKDNDKIARLTAEVWERATQCVISDGPFDAVMRGSVNDLLLYGRGVGKVYYKPELQKIADPMTGQPIDQKVDEKACPCNIFREDFLTNNCRLYEDVRWQAFREYMSKDELSKRFGSDYAKKIELDSQPEGDDAKKEDNPIYADLFKRASVWEVWDKQEKKVMWFAKGCREPLDVKPDYLGLHGFFPAPRPLYSTLTTSCIIPTPDYHMIRGQLANLNQLTQKIELLNDALNVAGIYDATLEGLPDLLSTQNFGKLIPVKNWLEITRGGGVKGAIEWVPMEQVVNVLQVCYQSRAQVIQEIYEITGISDVLRGASDPNETATAQNIKGQFGNLRISTRQQEVQRFARDIIAMIAELVAEHFEPEKIRELSGYDYMTGANPEDPAEWAGIVALLQDDPRRRYTIDIETDSTLALDEQNEKQRRNEFVEATGNFLQQAVPAMDTHPTLAPMMKEMMMFVVRGYKAGRGLETVIENTFEQIEQKIKEAEVNPPPPPPEVMIEQQKAQVEMAKLEVEKTKVGSDQQAEMSRQQTEMVRAQIEERSLQAQVEIENMKLQQMAMKTEQMKIQQQTEMMKLQLAQSDADALEREAAESEGAESKQQPIVINNVIPPPGQRMVTISGPLEQRTGIIQDVPSSGA